jgi:hypothetical protein
MKILNRAQDQDKMTNLLENTNRNRIILTVWQNVQGKRKVFIARIDKLFDESIQMSSYYQKNFNFISNIDVFVYCEKMNFVFKTSLENQEMVIIQLKHPYEVTMLDAVEAHRMQKTFDQHMKGESETEKINQVMQLKKIDEDQAYAHLREAPRKKVSKEQMVTVAFENKKFNPKEYDLFDLSTGGAGVIVKNQELFVKGEFLLLTHLDGRELNPPLRGEIMSIRSYDIEQGMYKVGLKFNT